MSFKVAEESLAARRGEVVKLLDATRRGKIDEDRFDWLYRKNPEGPAVLWSIRHEKTGEMAGFTVALPRRMMVEGKVRTCWNGADFSMKPKFRTLGLAIKLRRAAKEGVDAGRVDFFYAHPNDRMAVIHTKAGHSPVGVMVRYARPLRAAPYLEAKVRSRRAAAALGAVIDPALRLAGRELRHRTTCRVRAVDALRFDDRYDRLFEEAAGSAQVVGVRDSRYLNWRYAENPLYKTQALEACEDGRLRGYLLYMIENGTAHIKDIFPPGDETVARDLIACAIQRARKIQLQSVSVVTLEGNPLDRYFGEFGFRRRPDGSRMFGYAAEGTPWRKTVLDARSWFITVGDRDT